MLIHVLMKVKIAHLRLIYDDPGDLLGKFL